jgi:hypothetical protein
LAPVDDGIGRPWGWLVSRAEPDREADVSTPSAEIQARLYPVAPSDVERALALATRLLATGKSEVTARDFLLVAEPDEAVVADLRRLGMALRSLGVRGRRLREGGSRDRVYDLRPLKQQFAEPS